MPKPYPIAIQVDGRTCKGDWQLLQGCRVYVRSAWGNDTAEGGCDKLQAVAERTLEGIVRAHAQARADEIARQQRELAKFSRPRRTRRPSHDGPEA